MDKEIKEFDDRNNLIYQKDSDGREYWWEYDENNREIHYKSIIWEVWQKYDENNNRIAITEQEYKEIEFRKKEKEYNSRTKCSRFELMEI